MICFFKEKEVAGVVFQGWSSVILRTNKTVGFGGTLGHIIRLRPLVVRLVHSEDYAVKNFLISCIMLVQSGFGYSKAIGGVVH